MYTLQEKKELQIFMPPDRWLSCPCPATVNSDYTYCNIEHMFLSRGGENIACSPGMRARADELGMLCADEEREG
jgi:hypothetical protein